MRHICVRLAYALTEKNAPMARDKGKPRVSKLAGATAKATGEADREDLFPEPGKYHVKFRECSSPEPVAGRSWEGLLVKLTGAGKNKKLGDVTQIYTTSQKALSQSAPRLRSLCRSLVGLSKQDDEAFGEFDPHGEFADAIYSNDMQAAAEYLAAHGKALPKSARAKDEDDALERLTNAEIEAVVTKGGDTDDGDWYRNTSFRPLAEESDDSEDDEDEDAPESEPAPKAKAKGKASKRAEPEDDEDDAPDSEEDDDDAPDSESESERRPAKKKARRK